MHCPGSAASPRSSASPRFRRPRIAARVTKAAITKLQPVSLAPEACAADGFQASTPSRKHSEGLPSDRSEVLPLIPSLASEVTLNVYSIGKMRTTKMLNCLLWPLGTGFYHCGVEVFGMEWSFSGTPSLAHDGIFCSAPRRCDGHTYQESLRMGTTTTSYSEFVQLLEALWKEDWSVKRYNLLTHNCCHFCDLLCEKLGVGPIPGWVKNLANAGAAIGTARNRFVRESCCRIHMQDSQAMQLVEQVEVTVEAPAERANSTARLAVSV